MAKLTHFAHPRGWHKGDQVVGFANTRGTPIAGRAAAQQHVGPLQEYHLQADYHEGVAVDLHFTNTPHRDQWLKWWRKA